MSKRNKSRPGGGRPQTGTAVNDAFSNPLFRLGYGSQSPVEATEYPLTRMTDNYALLNSLYRDNWVVQNVVGLMVDDMLREWYRLTGDVTPAMQSALSQLERQTRIRTRMGEGLRWGRLYGGAAGLILINGQERILDRPLDLETVYPGSFQGLYILDRWQGVTPGTELTFECGEPVPEYYSINDGSGHTAARVHCSRIIRFTGRDLPYLERTAELYWGESEVEALYRDVVNHDNVSANMVALTFQANVNTMEVKGLEQLLSLASPEVQRRFWNTLQAQSVLRSNFGMQLVEQGTKLTNNQYGFAGLKDVYESMCLNLCGASHYPMTKLFGRSPSGLDATGDGDLQNYYDYVDSQREAKMRPALQKLLPVMAMSAWGEVPENLEISFPPLWTPTAKELAEIAKSKAEAILSVFQAGLMQADTAQKELKKLSDETGLFGSLTEEEILQNAGKTYQDVTALRDPLMGLGFGEDAPGAGSGQEEPPSPFEGAARDAAFTEDYSPSQPRDKRGRWTKGGSGLQSAAENGTMGLTEAEEYAVSKYVGKDSYLINEKLRSGEALTREEQRFVDNLDRALDKMPSYRGEVIRTLKFDNGEALTRYARSHRLGQNAYEASYISASVRSGYHQSPNVVIRIAAKKNAVDLREVNPGEQEILFKRGTSFFVHSAVLKNGVIYLEMEEVE